MKRHGIASSPFGPLLMAESEQGLCWTSFVDNLKQVPQQLEEAFPGETCSQDDEWSQCIMDQWLVDLSTPRLAPHGTTFQKTVWNILSKISCGKTVSYSRLACLAGNPDAIRATASAVARNPIAIFIPCHRVLPKDGSLGQYRWGSERKQALLNWEKHNTPIRGAHPQS